MMREVLLTVNVLLVVCFEDKIVMMLSGFVKKRLAMMTAMSMGIDEDDGDRGYTDS